jgi:signal transduction histidine kinase
LKDKRQKPGRKLSIKWKLFGWLALFCGLMLALLWTFQVVFLDSFYKIIKTQSLRSSGDAIVRNIDSEDLDQLVNRIVFQNNISVRIVNQDGGDVLSESQNIGKFWSLPANETQLFYQRAEENGGSLFETFSKESFKFSDPDDHRRFVGKLPPQTEFMSETMIYVRLVDKADGSKLMVMVHSTITPIHSTVETLRVQLVCITLIMLVLSLTLAFLISRKISQPIIQINQTAKLLAKGVYDVNFAGSNFLEISELSDTLNYAAVELSKVEALRRELIANISHDLRTPLTMITGYAEVMRDLPGENTPENIQIIIDEAKRLSVLVNDILDLSKLQSGVLSLTPSVFNLTQNIKDILTRYSKLTEQDGFHIKFICGGNVFVNADPVKMNQVVYNLINNAINYAGPDKQITVCQSTYDHKVKIEVIDSGEGISEEQLPYIWDRYYKVDKKHKRSAVGTGLGLSIVKTILDMHHANYSVVSSIGQGSIFWFELEIAEPSALTVEEDRI